MTADAAGTLDEAYERLHRTGPEFQGWLSNHGPMATEAMARHGQTDQIPAWLDGYVRRLEEFPRGTGPIGTDWRPALGDPRRVADWTGYFHAELTRRPWPEVLNEWWPRLLPGVVASATHGVIRVGHAVRTLQADGVDEVRLTELAHGLAYWAARWQTLPAGHATAAAAAQAGRARAASMRDLLAAVPRIRQQEGGFRDRLSRLDSLPGWPETLSGAGALAVPAQPEQIRAALTELVDAAVIGYLTYGHGNGIMLVHSATAPNAILRTLPVLDEQAWASSLAAAWAASSALMAVYAPAAGGVPAVTAEQEQIAEPASRPVIAEETFGRAVEHGDEHVIKFADTAIEVYARTGNSAAIAAAIRATELIEA
ncbi:MAG TPA: questin oxidase family protein [Streptosporangiaceae bacterium]|jgi:hypothetical protein